MSADVTLTEAERDTLWNSIDLAMRPIEPSDEVDWRWVPPPVRRRH